MAQVTTLRNDNLIENDRVMIRRLGDGKEYRAIVKGHYAVDTYGNPECYIVQMIDKLDQRNFIVFVRSVVDLEIGGDW